MDTPDTDALTAFAARLRADAQASGHRRALVLAGDPDWNRARAEAVVTDIAVQEVLWLGHGAPEGIEAVPPEKAGAVLGREFDSVVIDAFSGFDVDAFGAVSGTVRGGGLLVLLAPPLERWPQFPDPEQRRIAVYPFVPESVTGRFLSRFIEVMRSAPGVAMVEQGRSLPPAPADEVSDHPEASADAVCRTADQARAVEAVIRVVTGHRRRPAVLTSDRGRGKSAALGIAAARLLERGVRNITVTGPRLEAVAPVFEHAGRLLAGAHTSRSRIEWKGRQIEFAPPDELALTPRATNLLLVDEAAAIPAPVLAQLLEVYSRIAFATTVHGYEGTGRGFAVRFNRVLDERTPDWKALRLSQPIRWADNDPVERFVFRALLLDAAAAPDEQAQKADPGTCIVEPVARDALLRDEASLSELFGLLVIAHYRTRPLDLRHLLDGPNLTVWVMRQDRHVVATALVSEEGGFDAKTARGVWEGRIRPHGHLLPESLAAHLGLEQAPRLRSARIMRIAVHPSVQGRGLGTRLIEAVLEQARVGRYDFVGSSFGANDELLRFWDRCDFRPVRISLKRGAASGEHSALVLHPLSAEGRALTELARERFRRLLPHLLADPVRDLEPDLAARLLRADRPRAPELDPQDWRDLVSFAFGRGVFEESIAPLHSLLVAVLSDPKAAGLMAETDRDALIAKVLQKHPFREAARIAHLTGRAQVVEAMRRGVRPLIRHYGEAWVQQEADALAAVWEPQGNATK